MRNDRTVFKAGGKKIPLLVEPPIWSLGKEYTAELLARQRGRLRQMRDGMRQTAERGN